MAKTRMVNTKFWTDGYVINKLDPSEKLLFVYLLTNPYTEICGIYEISLKVMAVETGFEKDTIERIIGRFEHDGKIMYRDGWVAIKNFIKHQSKNPKVEKGIELGLEKAPQELKDFVRGIAYDSLSHLNLNSNPNPNPNSNASQKVVVKKKDDDSGFLTFWQSYPRKIAKKSAERSYSKIPQSERQKILPALEKHKRSDQWRKDDGKFIPYPATWLNQERWQDELEIKNSASEKVKLCPLCKKRPATTQSNRGIICWECYTN